MAEFDFLFEDEEPVKDDSGLEKTNDTEARAEKLMLKKFQIKKQRLDNIKNLTSVPKKGEVFFFLVDSVFDAVSFCDLVLDTHSKLDYLMAVSYSFSRITAVSFRNYFESAIIKEMRIIATSSLKARYKDAVAIFEKLNEDSPLFNLTYTHSHAKIMLMQNEDDYYILTGSGNLAKNSRIEQYFFLNNKELFMFIKENMEKMVIVSDEKEDKKRKKKR